MKQLQLTPAQRLEFQHKFNERMKKLTMGWTPELKEWYPIALESLDYIDCRTLQIPQEDFVLLFEEEKLGLNMYVVQSLCNSVETVKPHEMGYKARNWAQILIVNARIATRWRELAMPHEKDLYKEYELASNLRIIRAEA